LRKGLPVPAAGWADRQVALALSQPLPMGLPVGFAQQMADLVRPARATFEWVLVATASLLLLAAGALALRLNPGLLAAPAAAWLQDSATGWLPWLAVALLVGAWPSHTAWRAGGAA
jgi:hypothetical protein